MSNQELSSAKYLPEKTPPDPAGTPAETQVESSESTGAAHIIKTINMLLLFVVIAGFSGGACWLYQHRDDVPRMNENDPQEVKMSVLSWLVGSDVTAPSEYQECDLERYKDYKVEIKPIAIPTFDGRQIRLRRSHDDDDDNDYQDYDEWENDY